MAEAQTSKLEKIRQVDSLRKPDKELTLRSKTTSALSKKTEAQIPPKAQKAMREDPLWRIVNRSSLKKAAEGQQAEAGEG